jgi:23S rRNA pseudouridine1911/1915/1917 synthase
VNEAETKKIVMPEESVGARYDSALAEILSSSRNSILALFINERITLKRAGMPKKVLGKSERVESGDVVEIDFTKEEIETVYSQPLPIIYEDSEIVVINKSVGYAAHPSPGFNGPTVTGALASSGVQLASSGPAEREGIVHRLDVGTSGLMVLAKSQSAYSQLKDQFRDRSVEKVYHAMVQGHLDPSEGSIDAPIDRHPKDDYKFAVVASGRPSVTHYEALEYFPAMTLVRVELETGRTHQIRVHFAAIKHPLVGDLVYGADPSLAASLKISRPWLHAMELTFTHPGNGERVHFRAEYPADLVESLASLRDSFDA